MFHYRAEVVKKEGNEVVWKSEFTSYDRAHRIERGLQINLNKETHFTRVVVDNEELLP